MKPSLLKDVISYAKTKGRTPLDERQMNILKDLYIELARAVIYGFMMLIVVYGFKDIYDVKIEFSFMQLSMSLLGGICYFYTLRFCSFCVIGLDANFEYLLAPALFFTPSLFHTTWIALCLLFQLSKEVMLFGIFIPFLAIFFLYEGLNLTYRRAKNKLGREDLDGDTHYRAKKQFIPIVTILIIIISIFPIDFQLFYTILLFGGSISLSISILYAVYSNRHDGYILSEDHLFFHRDLWGRKGTQIAYCDIIHIEQTDTFHIGYAKDKVRIRCHNGKSYLLYPENAYTFYEDLLMNIT